MKPNLFNPTDNKEPLKSTDPNVTDEKFFRPDPEVEKKAIEKMKGCPACGNMSFIPLVPKR